MDRCGVEPACHEALEGVGASRGLESVMDSLEAWRLLVYFVDPIVSEGQGGVRLSCMCVYSKKFGDGGFFPSVFLEGMADARNVYN